MRFRGTVVLGGKTATGIQVPAEVVESFGTAKRPKVTVSLGGHTYRTTVFSTGGEYWVPLSAENRTAAGVQPGDAVDVDVEADTAPREVALPEDLAAALDAEARAFFDTLSFTHRHEWVRWVDEAKRPQTRTDRIAKTAAALGERRRTR